jgi:hypothetical protein
MTTDFDQLTETTARYVMLRTRVRCCAENGKSLPQVGMSKGAVPGRLFRRLTRMWGQMTQGEKHASRSVLED